MAADDVYLALVQLDDPEVRAATSDTAQLGHGFDFSDEERQLVQAVIDEAQSDDEVGGFAGGAMFGAMNYCSGRGESGRAPRQSSLELQLRRPIPGVLRRGDLHR